MDIRSEIGRQRAQPPRQADRKRQQDRLLHAFADPADPLAQQGDELHRNGGLAFEEAEEIVAHDDEQLDPFLGGRVGGARLAVERRDRGS
jgi:hypothetical protein